MLGYVKNSNLKTFLAYMQLGLKIIIVKKMATSRNYAAKKTGNTLQERVGLLSDSEYCILDSTC